MGISPGTYLDTLRLQHALRLLRDTSMSLKEIVPHAGLSSQSYFCALVRKAVGMTPTQYRSEKSRR
jgi:AraC-like DNA-binding protein